MTSTQKVNIEFSSKTDYDSKINIIKKYKNKDKEKDKDEDKANKKQRDLSKSELGKNITKDHNVIYEEIEKRIGKTKICNFGHSKGSKTGVKHEGEKNVNVRDFELKGVELKDNKVIIKNGDGLQGFCRDCSKRRRKARITTSKNKFKDINDNEIRELYIKEYGLKTKKCSQCKEDLLVNNFSISKGMECGLHNMCYECSMSYGNSVGARWILYLPDGNYKYKNKNKDQHDDHIFPLSCGGSNNECNHQLINCITNLEKSNSIEFKNVNDINKNLLSERFQHNLDKCKNIEDLKCCLRKQIYNEWIEKSKMNDDELEKIFIEYTKKNNVRYNCKRAICKFRDFCIKRNIS
jgi:hypothetical protein